MTGTLLFILQSALLGVGLAMDAFSVSLANGLHEPQMTKKKAGQIAGIFAFFQALMPLIGWLCVHTIVQLFQKFETFIPWIALILLVYIGGSLLKEGLGGGEEEEEHTGVDLKSLLIQGIATSIDALSVGFTIAEYGFIKAFCCAAIIAVVTFFICAAGVAIGKKAGMKYAGKANILGGVILILIGIEIFITGIF